MIIDLFGDMGSIENAIDVVFSGIPIVELDSVDIEVRNEGITDDY